MKIGINWNLKLRERIKFLEEKNSRLRTRNQYLEKKIKKYENNNTRTAGDRKDNNVVEFSGRVHPTGN